LFELVSKSCLEAIKTTKYYVRIRQNWSSQQKSEYEKEWLHLLPQNKCRELKSTQRSAIARDLLHHDAL